MAELNKLIFTQKSSTAWTFCCLVLGINLYLHCNYVIFITILLNYLYTVFSGIFNIYTCILLSLVIFTIISFNL